ncbi:MAG: 3-isopropylmalate dehydratase large subunit [Alphaproteobacteria bacterium]|nr:3-isopropylmalate dehydratase large subunit [Alphaproteobacteria bacterium]
MATTATLFDKVWDSHVVATLPDGSDLLHIDRHLTHEMTSARAFENLRAANRSVRNPEITVCVQDHILSTAPGRGDDSYDRGTPFIRALRQNARNYGIRLFDIDDPEQGIVHVMAPELGVALPGLTAVCGDSHTCTIGAVGAVAFGIGTSEVEHVLATQTLVTRKPLRMRVVFDGVMAPGVSPKDLSLYLIARIGTAGGTGHAAEYAGRDIRAMSMEGRMTVCNMSIELGSRIGMVAPDDTTFDYLSGTPYAPTGEMWDRALATWRALPSDEDAVFDKEVRIDVADVAPQISWGNSPQDVIGVGDVIPDPADGADRRKSWERAIAYMGLEPGTPIEGLPIDKAFIGSCTNSRLADLRAAARILDGRKVADGVRALAVPGSASVKRAAEAEGLDVVFRRAGFDWREPGCSMCAGMNDDHVAPGERCIATTNRNFEGRQGPGSRTHLASPAMVAAAAVEGRIADVRKLMG